MRTYVFVVLLVAVAVTVPNSQTCPNLQPTTVPFGVNEMVPGEVYPVHDPFYWKYDTLPVRAILDSNRYRGSCTTFISSIWASGPTSSPATYGYVHGLRFKNCTWLKKIPKDIEKIKKLVKLEIINCNSLTAIEGIHPCMETFRCTTTTVSSITGTGKFQGVFLVNCPNITKFPWAYRSNNYGFSIIKCPKIDITGFDLSSLRSFSLCGDSLTLNRLTGVKWPTNPVVIYMDNNLLTDIPSELVAAYRSVPYGSGSLYADTNRICHPSAELTQLLDRNTTRNWRSTQDCTVGAITILKHNTVKKNSTSYQYDFAGRVLSKTPYSILIGINKKEIGTFLSKNPY